MRTTDITSFTAHRQHLRAHLNQVRETGRPLFITTNGQTDAVVLSPEFFDQLSEAAELAQSLNVLDRSMDDLKEGRTRQAKEAIKAMGDQLNLALNR